MRDVRGQFKSYLILLVADTLISRDDYSTCSDKHDISDSLPGYADSSYCFEQVLTIVTHHGHDDSYRPPRLLGAKPIKTLNPDPKLLAALNPKTLNPKP